MSQPNEKETLIILEQVITNLDEKNFDKSIGEIFDMHQPNFPYSFNFVLTNLLYYAFCSQKNSTDIYIKFLETIQTKDQEIIKFFGDFISKIKSQEAYYLIEKMVQRNLIDINIVNQIRTKFFAHYKTEKQNKVNIIDPFNNYLIKNYEELSKNDWELHKQLIKEGINPNEILKIIRNDEIEKLQEISSQTNFDFNQTIQPSLYERYSFINKENVTLIDFTAFFGSVKCFKYLLMNGAKVENTGKYAVAGGNEEIIHLCEQNHSSFVDAYETAIEFHRNDIFKYLYENKFEKFENINNLGSKCIHCGNYIILFFLEKDLINNIEYIIDESAKFGNLYLVKYFIQNYQIPKDILIQSLMSGNIELIKYIITQDGIDFNFKDNNEQTALVIASRNGYVDIVKLLLEQEGIDINAKDENGNTALILASSKGYTEIVKQLLEQKGIDIHAKNNGGFTALTYASYYGSTEIVKSILGQEKIKINDDIKHEEEKAFIFATENGYIEIVKLLLKQEGIDINAKDKTCGKTALVWASLNGHIEIVKLLLKQEGIDINAKDNRDGKTAIICASENGYTEIVKLLLEQEGIDINAQDNIGKTALIFASENGNKEIVKLLLEQNGIVINAQDDEGNTALINASMYDEIETVKLLLEQKGIGINTKNKYGETALLIAMKNRKIQIVKLLLDQKGIDLNAKDNHGDHSNFLKQLICMQLLLICLD